MSAHKAHRASLDPRASLVKKAIQAHRAYRGSRDLKEWLDKRGTLVTSVRQVLIVVVLGVVVVAQ